MIGIPYGIYERVSVTPSVPHCSGSDPSACPDTEHSQCDYTILVINKLHILPILP